MKQKLNKIYFLSTILTTLILIYPTFYINKMQFKGGDLFFYFFVFFILFLNMGIFKKCSENASKKIISAVSATLVFVIFLLDLFLFKYSYLPDQTFFFILLQTHRQEVFSFLINNYMIPLGLVFVFFILYYGVTIIYKTNTIHLSKSNLIALSFGLVCIFLTLPLVLKPNGNYSLVVKDFKSAKELISTYSSNRDPKIKEGIFISKSEAQPGNLFFVVIGESDNRTHWSAMGYSRPTTPLLKNKIETLTITPVKNAFSSDKFTVTSLALALTEINQYSNSKKFNEAVNIIDVLKKGNFHTTWISNHSIKGNENASFNIIAQQCDFKYFIDQDSKFAVNERPFDELLIPIVRKIPILPDKPNVIFVHIEGSHFPYESRYPSSFAKFKGSNVIDEYDNSILYTDNIINSLLDIAIKKGTNAFFYFSDHGELPGVGRDSVNLEMFKIPFFAYFKGNNKKSEVFIDNSMKNKPFTNDLFFETFLDCIGIESNVIDKKHSYCNNDFILKKESNIRLMLSKKILVDGKLISSSFKNFFKIGEEYRISNEISPLYTGFLTKGWSVPENEGVWTNGKNAELQFQNTPKEAKYITLVFQPFVFGSYTPILTLKSNEKVILNNQEVAKEFSIKIPLDRQKNNTTIHINIKEVISPKSLGINSDTRLIGIKLKKYYFS